MKAASQEDLSNDCDTRGAAVTELLLLTHGTTSRSVDAPLLSGRRLKFTTSTRRITSDHELDFEPLDSNDFSS